MDLFEDYKKQPKNLKVICNKWLEVEELDYIQCEEFLKEVQAIGYTFNYELGSEPFNLRLIP